MPFSCHNFIEKRKTHPEYNSKEENHEGEVEAILGKIPRNISTKEKYPEKLKDFNSKCPDGTKISHWKNGEGIVAISEKTGHADVTTQKREYQNPEKHTGEFEFKIPVTPIQYLHNPITKSELIDNEGKELCFYSRGGWVNLSSKGARPEVQRFIECLKKIQKNRIENLKEDPTNLFKIKDIELIATLIN